MFREDFFAPGLDVHTVVIVDIDDTWGWKADASCCKCGTHLAPEAESFLVFGRPMCWKCAPVELQEFMDVERIYDYDEYGRNRWMLHEETEAMGICECHESAGEGLRA